MKKVGDHTWYDEDEIKLDTDDIEGPGYTDESGDENENGGCGGATREMAEEAFEVILMVLAFGLMLSIGG
jgi:hypothetical protein